MRYRAIHTKIWSDRWFRQLKPDERLVFIYLISNRFTTASGAYHILLDDIERETGVADAEEVVRRLCPKVLYWEDDEIVWVPKFIHHQNRSPKFLISGVNDVISHEKPDLAALFWLRYQTEDVRAWLTQRLPGESSHIVGQLQYPMDGALRFEAAGPPSIIPDWEKPCEIRCPIIEVEGQYKYKYKKVSIPMPYLSENPENPTIPDTPPETDAAPSQVPYQKIQTRWNGTAGKAGCVMSRSITACQDLIRARWREMPDLQVFEEVFAAIGADPWCRGEGGDRNWRASLAYAVSKKGFYRYYDLLGTPPPRKKELVQKSMEEFLR